jgi:hypothetical protein
MLRVMPDSHFITGYDESERTDIFWATYLGRSFERRSVEAYSTGPLSLTLESAFELPPTVAVLNFIVICSQASINTSGQYPIKGLYISHDRVEIVPWE